MATFNELVEMARNPGVDFVLDGAFIAELANAHEESLTGAAGDAEVWTEEKLALETALQERDSTISHLRSQNYDLLTKLPQENAGDNGGESDDSDDNDANDIDLDDLFE